MNKMHSRLSILALASETVALFLGGALGWPSVQQAAPGDAQSPHERFRALRRAMLARLNISSDPDNACPALWAPLVAAGEGSSK